MPHWNRGPSEFKNMRSITDNVRQNVMRDISKHRPGRAMHSIYETLNKLLDRACISNFIVYDDFIDSNNVLNVKVQIRALGDIGRFDVNVVIPVAWYDGGTE